MTRFREYWFWHILLVALLVFVGYRSYSRPIHSWDEIAYIAVVYQRDGYSGQELHQRTFEDLKANVSPEAYEALRTVHPYKIEISKSPEALEQQLPWYRVRPLYNTILQLAHKAGLPITPTALWLSLFSILGVLLLVYLWIGRVGSYSIAWFSTVLMTFALDAGGLARYPTPDPLCALFVVGAFFLLYHKKTWPALAVLAVAVFIRNDTGLIAAGAAFYAWWLAKFQGEDSAIRRYAWVYAIGCLALGFLISGWAGHYGYRTHFYHSYIEYQPYPKSLATFATPQQMVGVYWKNLLDLNFDRVLWALLLALVAREVLSPGQRRMLVLPYTLLGILCVRWLVFPSFETRLTSGLLITVVTWIFAVVVASRSQKLNQLPELPDAK